MSIKKSIISRNSVMLHCVIRTSIGGLVFGGILGGFGEWYSRYRYQEGIDLNFILTDGMLFGILGGISGVFEGITVGLLTIIFFYPLVKTRSYIILYYLIVSLPGFMLGLLTAWLITGSESGTFIWRNGTWNQKLAFQLPAIFVMITSVLTLEYVATWYIKRSQLESRQTILEEPISH